MEKYYSESTIRNFIEDCKDINGNINLDRLDKYLNKRFDLKISDEFVDEQKVKQKKALDDFSDWYGQTFSK